MEIVIMHPKNQEQLAALKAVAKAMKVDFEIDNPGCKPDHNPNALTAKTIADTRNGKGVGASIKNVKEFIDSL